MRIQHNIAALNSYRNLTGNNSAVSKNLEKLSSGYRINRAGDDAAGLAISEKMRAQITGLETAQKNAQDGISLVQTAEGALTEVHSMLNRMVELADQSANGTYDNETDRANLQKEVQSLKEEINRISKGTNFNGINLLDGSLGGITGEPDVKANFATAPTLTAQEAKAATYTGSAAITAGTKGAAATYSLTYSDTDGNSTSVNVDYTSTGDAVGDAKAIADALNKNGLGGLFEASVSLDTKIVLTASEKGSAHGTVSGFTEVKGKDAGTKISANPQNGDSLIVDGKSYTLATATDVSKGQYANVGDIIKQLKIDGYSVVNDAGAAVSNTLVNSIITRDPSSSGKGLTLQIGDTADGYNQLKVSIGNMNSKSLGIDSIDVSTQTGAKDAVQRIKDAINSVSSTRGDLGAIQNRLEHTINNLSVTTENMTAAESRIRDVDMADEMMAYTKNNILVQASQAMLAQANQIPQGVLQLLQ